MSATLNIVRAIELADGEQVELAFHLSAASDEYVSARFVLSAADMAETSGRVGFEPGQTEQSLRWDLPAATAGTPWQLDLSDPMGLTLGRPWAPVLPQSEASEPAATPVASPAISVADIVVSEGDDFAYLTVQLNAPGLNAVSVNYATANGSASSGNFDYTAVSGTLNFAVGETSKVVQVALSEASGVEYIEHFRLNLSAAVNATIAKASAMVTIVDNDTISVSPSVFVRDVIVDEMAGSASFVVMLGGSRGQASNSTVTVDYATAHGTATGSDYTAASGTLTFAPGESVKTVTVAITDDAVDEGVERFSLNLSNAVNATILDGQGVGEIGASDGSASASPRLSVADVVVGEADGYVDVVVRLSGPGQNPVAVNYAGAQISATANGFDYEGVNGTLNFAVGETTKTVRIELSQYSGVEPIEHFRLNLSGAVNATIDKASAMITIIDNDTVSASPGLFVRDAVVDEMAGTASFVVLLGGPTGQASNSTVTVDYATAHGTAVGSDYVAASGTLTFAPGETVKTVVVDIKDDAVDEGVERFSLNLSNAVNATILDGQGVGEIGASDGSASASPRLSVADVVVGEADGYVDVVVRLSGPGQNPVAVNYAGAQISATANGFDYEGVNGTLNFAVGETTKTVRIELSQYSGVEPIEHFRLNLSGAVNATIDKASAMITIIDNDTVSASPGLFVRDAVVDEMAGTASFVVLLGGPTGQASNSTVTVDYATAHGTAVGSDYVAASGTLTFAPGETVKTVVVDINDDAVDEGVERFSLNLSNAVNATILDGQGVGEIGASDGSASAQPRLSVADVVVGEADGYVDVVVRLSGPGQNPVAVNYAGAQVSATANGFDYEGVNGTLNFAVGETTKTVRIELSQYSGVEPIEHFRLNLSGAVNATIDKASAMVTIIDNDTVSASPGLFVRDAVVDEMAGTASFVVLLGGPKGQASNSTVTVDYTTVDGTADVVSDYAAASGTLTFAPGETVKTIVVDIRDDGAVEDAERFSLVLSNAVNATIMDANGVAVIQPNDGATVIGPVIVATDTTVSEADGYVDVVVALSAASNSAVSVNYITANGTATGNGFDFEGVSGTLNFAPGETSKTVRIEISPYTGAESLEQFRLNLSAPSNATLGTAFATISIVDDDNGISVLSYGISDDVYRIGSAADIIVENPGGGNDTVESPVDYTLGANLENLTLIAPALAGTGNELDNLLLGNAAANTLTGLAGDDTLDGAGGSDTMNGGLGDDLYVVDDAGDVIIEGAGGGRDTVQSSIDYTLGLRLENLVLTGSANLSGTGNGSANAIFGNSGNNLLDGKGGADTLTGGLGDDTYIIDNDGVVVKEQPGEGIDTVVASIDRTLYDGVENLVLAGSADLTGSGNALDNLLTGNNGANLLSGLAGNDTLDGRGGSDKLVGGSGNDSLDGGGSSDSLLGGDGDDLLLGGSGVGTDTLRGGLGNDTLVGGAGDDTMSGDGGIDLADYSDSPASVTASLGARTASDGHGGTDKLNSLENLRGSAFDDSLSGNGGANELTGLSGADSLAGGGGNDSLYGGDGNDTLNGGPAVDLLVGGLGDDLYIVENSGDSIVELAGQGIDSVQSAVSNTLGDHVENLQLTGQAMTATGNQLDNILTGNAQNNTLTARGGDDSLYGGDGADTLHGGGGNDLLDGGPTADSMIGGNGDDTYLTDNSGDIVVEEADGGIDTVISRVSTTLGEHVEHLELAGFAMTGDGNALDNRMTGNGQNNTLAAKGGNDTLDGAGGNDTLHGGGGEDWLEGGSGIDSLIGGSGNDHYGIDNSRDVIVELAGQGNDSVTSSISYTLGAEVENLTLIGSAKNGTGNSAANRLTGNGEDNRLYGGAGDDTLTGGAGADSLSGGGGADRFVLDDILSTDTITDFSSGLDKILLSQAGIAVGNGDNVIDGATTIVGPGGFSNNAELVVVTGNIAGTLDKPAAVAAIGNANSAYAIGDTALFAVDNGGQSKLFLFTAQDADASVEAHELTLLATLTSTPATSSLDYLFGP